jgi:2-polyprenyl-6-methoxyphenol hydroxylase-like FAD-dependent oxidoreductase
VATQQVLTNELDCDQSTARDRLIQSFTHFSPGVQKIVSQASEDVGLWTLHDMQSLPTWTKDRLVLIGDAAHPFLPCESHPQRICWQRRLTSNPVLGQGGAMAIEDGICLARLLLPETSADAVCKRLQMFEQLRHKRVEFVRDETRQNGLDESERPNSSSYLTSACINSRLTGSPDMYPMMKHCYEHDAWTHTDKYLEASLSSSDHE